MVIIDGVPVGTIVLIPCQSPVPEIIISPVTAAAVDIAKIPEPETVTPPRAVSVPIVNDPDDTVINPPDETFVHVVML